MTKTYLMNNLIDKMESPDQDHRYMGLTDLMSEIRQDPNNLNGDENVEMKVLKQVLKLVEDKISEVKNQAVKCLGVLIKIMKESQMEFVIDKLVDFSASKDEELRDIAGLALKTVTAELPLDSNLAPSTCTKLTPKLLNQLQNPLTPPETLIETLSILSILITRFSTHISGPEVQSEAISVFTFLLKHPRPAVRKRTIMTLAQFLPISSQNLSDELLKSTVFPGLGNGSGAASDVERTTVFLVAAMARHAPQKISSALADIVPRVIKATNQDDDELREGALQALEALVLRCPTEITPFLSQIMHVGSQLIKYDPNYAADEDDGEDVAMADADDDDDDAGLDEYSDDEDTSYKIRRSATKLLAALVHTRPELLASLYKDVSPVLISRFSDREETVKLEIWSTYVALLNQTRIYGGVPQAHILDSGIGGKRKRDDDGEGMDVEETPFSLLKSQVPSLAKALLNQLKGQKTPPSLLQAGFELLIALVNVLPGCLLNNVGPITSISKFILSQSPSSSNSVLHTTCLSFLYFFFSSHSPPTFVNSLPSLTPALLHALGERHPRVVSETFRVFSALLRTLNPVRNLDWLQTVYIECVRRLRSADTDAEVRERAEECMGDLWICATDMVRAQDGAEWEALFRTTGRIEGAIRVVTRVSKELPMGDAWLNGSVEWLLSVLRKAGKAGKNDAFTCLDALLRGYENGPPDDIIPILIQQMTAYISLNDISLLSQSLLILSLLLQLSPKVTFPEIEREQHLKAICSIAHSPIVSGAALDALLAFFNALVEADNEISTHIIPKLVISLDKAPRLEASAANVAKCVGQVVKSQRNVAAGTIAEFSKYVKKGTKAKDTQVLLSLLVFGELGRFIDFSPQKDLFDSAIDLFGAGDEEVRSAAAFAAGNIAIGNLHLFLPIIVKLVQTNQAKRLLALHSVKEVVSNCPPGQLENVAETIWVPLFEDSANSEEATRNVAAACLGRLTTTNPLRYLPQLQARIRDADPAARATGVAAIRYTFADTTRSFDDQLLGLVGDFLTMMADQDLTVRRLALSALNSAARNKPHLIRDSLNMLMPSVYKETLIREELIRTVQMGPWTHKVDDGLEARKTAFETMYTLLDTCLSSIELHEFLSRVVFGLSDDSDEIKVLSHMMLFRLAQLSQPHIATGSTSSPAMAAASSTRSSVSLALIQRLDEITPALEATMKGPAVTKDTVKQDLERAAELQRSALRAVAALNRIYYAGGIAGGSSGWANGSGVNAVSQGTAPRFEAFIAEIQKGSFRNDFRELSGGL